MCNMGNNPYLQIFNFCFSFSIKKNPTNALQFNLGSYLDDASVQAIYPDSFTDRHIALLVVLASSHRYLIYSCV